MAKFCPFFACLLLAGCAHRPVRPNIDVPLSCVRKVVMVHCDPSTEPPRCEKIAVTYVPGCGQLQAAR
ncbi:MAG TPA: hypothetical protein VFF58_00735 [Candidatus Nitrosotalea sp.]|nr:hypothetical protein [Candidatus Nitrosotalea sp.]